MASTLSSLNIFLNLLYFILQVAVKADRSHVLLGEDWLNNATRRRLFIAINLQIFNIRFWDFKEFSIF